MKPRFFFTALALAVVILLVIGGGGAYWLASNSVLANRTIASTTQTVPEATMFVSKRSPVVLTLNQVQRLTASSFALTPPTQRRALQTEIKNFEARLLTQTQLDYGRDIQPWIGDEVVVALAEADLDRDDSNGAQPGYLAAIATARPQQAKQSLAKFWQKHLAATEDYLGVDINHSSNQFSSAIVGDRFVLFANSPKVIRAALNNVQASENLANNKRYQEAIGQLPESLGVAYVNVAPSASPTGQNLDQKLDQKLLIAFQLHPQGLLADTRLITSENTSGKTRIRPALSAPVDALKLMPENASVTAGGTNVKQILTDFNSAAAAPFRQELLRRQETWGIDLAQEIFSWMPGDYALGVLPRESSGGFDQVFVTKRSPDTEAGLAKLDALVATRGVSVGKVPLGDTPVTAWTKLQTTPKNRSDLMTIEAKVEGVHATVKNYEIFATSLEALEQVVQAAQPDGVSDLSQGLPKAFPDKLQTAIATLEPRNNGYLTVDGAAVRTWMAKNDQRRAIAQRIQPLLDRLKSITISNYGQDEQGDRNGVLIQLKK
jgi:hypothetical protein